MARRERSNPEWQALIAEHQILKRKLQSKSEALLIISKDLDKSQNERDQFKLMAEKLQERCQAFKKMQAEFPVTGDKAILIQMLKDVRSQKQAYQKQNEQLQLKLNEALGDVKLLREKFARQTIGDEGIGARHFPSHEREKLVLQLEESQQLCEHWRKEYESQAEVACEAIADRDASRLKADRLNQELLYAVSGDKRRIIDVDALCMENKYLQDRITQCQSEKNTLHDQINKYKKILSSRKTPKNDLHKPGILRSSGVVVSPKQLKELLANGVSENSAEKVADLQSIVSALLETVNDKNLAMHHLRNTNKILGNRVADLERKLKTLEVGGLWNVHGVARSNSSGSSSSPVDLLGSNKSVDLVNGVEELVNSKLDGEVESLPCSDVDEDRNPQDNNSLDVEYRSAADSPEKVNDIDKSSKSEDTFERATISASADSKVNVEESAWLTDSPVDFNPNIDMTVTENSQSFHDDTTFSENTGGDDCLSLSKETCKTVNIASSNSYKA